MRHEAFPHVRARFAARRTVAVGPWSYARILKADSVVFGSRRPKTCLLLGAINLR